MRRGAGGRRRRTRIEGQFAPRLIEMLRSAAFSVLSLSAHRLLVRIEIELADHGGTDNGKLPVTFEDFRRFGTTWRQSHQRSASARHSVSSKSLDAAAQAMPSSAGRTFSGSPIATLDTLPQPTNGDGSRRRNRPSSGALSPKFHRPKTKYRKTELHCRKTKRFNAGNQQ
jgi:hypothetical protein